jgi:hypothetical protein
MGTQSRFLRLLVSYVRVIAVQKSCKSNLASKEIATLIFEVSGGNLGDLNRLLVECAKEAILQGEEEITYDIVHKFKWLKPTEV